MTTLRTFGPPSSLESFRVTTAQLPVGSYADRAGYDPAFLSEDDPLPLPGPGRWADDRVPLKDDVEGPRGDRFEIAYTHFSVVMARSRALPLFSACNIDGKALDRDIERTDLWRTDPRIEARYQLLRQGYGHGNQGLFSRGHMTRREDPNWGDKALATQSDADTFHIPNVAPQRQGFNAGVWLDLENYVLDNTDDEDLRVSVITGPILGEGDPTYYERRIPVDFWKIIAFRHARTKALTTIGYKRSQLTYLPKPNRSTFVFGDFDDTQVPILSLQEETGLDLTAYADFDVMQGAEPGLEVRLSGVSDLYLVR